MRIAFITNFCPFYRIKLFKILAKEIGAEFFFFSDASEKNWENLNPINNNGLPVIPLYNKNKSKIKLLSELYKKLNNKNYDAYIQGISGRFIVPITFLTAKFKKKPFILWTGFWNHPNTFFHRLTFPIVKFIYKHSDAIVTYGAHVNNYLISLGVDKNKIFIAQNTADNEIYNKDVTDEEKIKLKKKLNAENCNIILFVGRLSIEKGVDILLNSIKILNQNKKLPKFKLIIIGRGTKKNDLINYANKNNIKNIDFLDYVENNKLYKFYAIADILIVPSVTTPTFKEPWGLIINEAMNQSTVVIASDAVGAAAGGLIKNEENGLIVPEKNPEQLADAIKSILVNPNLKNNLAINAKNTIKNWTYNKMADGFIAAVNSVLSK